MAKSRVIGSNEKRVQVKDLRSKDILSYDIDNIYPQRIKNTIASSGTGTACTRMLKSFLYGRGFANVDLAKTKINAKGQTFSQVHELVCKDYALFRGAALHVNYNGLFEAISINHIPFEYVRLNIPDDFGNVDQCKIYEDWDNQLYKRFKAENVKSIDFFTLDPEKIAAQIEGVGGFDKWNGHIIYFSADGFHTYPTSTSDPVLENVETDAGIKTFMYRNIKTGFMAGAVFVHKGTFEDEDAREEFQDNLEAFQGADNSSKLFLVEAETEEQVPEIKSFPIISNDKLFEYSETSVRDNIIRSYGQPLVLHAIKTPGSLGNSTEWDDAKLHYDEHTESDRNLLGELYREVLSVFEGIKAGEDFDLSIIPTTGVKEKSKKVVLADTIGVGGMQSLQTIITDPTMKPEQKINYCVLVFGMNPKDADALINGSPIPNE